VNWREFWILLRWMWRDSASEEQDQEARTAMNHYRQRTGHPLLTREQFDAADRQTAARIAEDGDSLRGRIRTMRWASRGGR
jgi:hypothetical protein